MTVRNIGGSVIFRLYHTDVITYHEDRTIDVIPYASQTTHNFAHHLLPSGIIPIFTKSCGPILAFGDWEHWKQNKCYLISIRTTLALKDIQWCITSDTEKFTRTLLDKKKARKALAKTN